MERVFQNVLKTAFLDKGIFGDIELLDQCMLYVEPLLEERPEIIVYGKPCKQHRNVGFFSDESIGYKYSKKLMKSNPLSKCMTDLLVIINNMMGAEFNGILVNKYMDGSDYISAHSDDETSLDTTIGVVAISYGSERIFRVRDKNNKTIICDEPTTHCGILHMGGTFQKWYTHEIPIQKKIKESRISFTFRKHTE
jgi:alpha-ketoglutarate-dependent dioxygenase alkB family protein 2